ncbi:MAG: hypothetical protein ACP5MH_11095 [Thermoproteus sp.]
MSDCVSVMGLQICTGDVVEAAAGRRIIRGRVERIITVADSVPVALVIVNHTHKSAVRVTKIVSLSILGRAQDDKGSSQ